MKIWLDDLRNPKDYEGFEDYKWFKNPLTVIKFIKMNYVTHISFDNDLGFFKNNKEIQGFNVAEVFEEMAFNKTLKHFPEWNIHSANPKGKKNIEYAMKNAEKYFNKI